MTAAAPAATAAPAAGAAPVVFTDISQTLGANDLIDYLTRRGSAIFEQGCKKLNNGLDGTKALRKSLLLPTVPYAQSTLSRAMAKSTRPLSKLHVRDFASLGSLTPRLMQNTTQ